MTITILTVALFAASTIAAYLWLCVRQHEADRAALQADRAMIDAWLRAIQDAPAQDAPQPVSQLHVVEWMVADE